MDSKRYPNTHEADGKEQQPQRASHIKPRKATSSQREPAWCCRRWLATAGIWMELAGHRQWQELGMQCGTN
eukprot:16446671-Heterocapsa_arctica.AAC.1